MPASKVSDGEPVALAITRSLSNVPANAIEPLPWRNAVVAPESDTEDVSTQVFDVSNVIDITPITD